MNQKSKLSEDLKKLSDRLSLIHDNHAVILSLRDQEKRSDEVIQKTLIRQIHETEKILHNNQELTLKILDEICELSHNIGGKLEEDCRKLDHDFKMHKSNPDLLKIQEDIKIIQKDLL